MKNIGLKLLIFILPLLVFSNRPEGKFKKLKTIQRTFQVGETGEVFIDNTYGNINIITDRESQVEIIVHISVDGNDDDAVEQQFRKIKINIIQNGSQIKAQTIFDKASSYNWNLFSWMFGGNSHNTNFKINYEVHMPQQWNLKIRNDYGNIYLNKLTGNLDLNADYGSFEIGELLSRQNNIVTDYFSHSTIDFVKQADIKADYSKLNITSAYHLDLNCDYTTIKIETVRQLKFNNDYGSIHVQDVKEVYGSGDYQTRSFGHINKVKFTGDYGSIEINGLLPDFERVDLSCDYTTIRINNEEKAPYHFELEQDYGCFKQNDLDIYREIIDNGDREIKAFYKDEKATALIKINMDYGCVRINN